MWTVLVSFFLYAYVVHFNAPASAVLPHLVIIGSLWCTLAALRLINARYNSHTGLQRWLAAILILAPLQLLTAWYAIALIGLSSWGRVTTWVLIKAYAGQSTFLIDALGISPSLVIVATAICAVFPIALGYRLVTRDWIGQLSASLSKVTVAILATLVIAIGGVQLAKFIAFPNTASQEPLGLSFLGSESNKPNQSHDFGNASLLDIAEQHVRRQYKPSKVSVTRNVVLIVGDALRADHMSLYGYSRRTTPFIEQLAQSPGAGVVKIAHAVCAESACGLMGLAASRPIHQMPDSPLTLHEALRRHGYKVHMVLGGDHTNFYGLKDRYGPVDSYFDGSSQRTRYMNDDNVLLDRLATFEQSSTDQPVMFQFHLMSTHGLGMRNPSALKYKPFVNYYRWPIRGIPPTKEEASRGINYYDNGMVQFDQMVEALLAKLKTKGYLENALVIITADHGEMLGEKGEFGHAHQVAEGAIRVPLIFIRYGYQGRAMNLRMPASQIDIAPTILEDLSLRSPDTWQGIALQHAEGSPRLVHFQQGNQAGMYASTADSKVYKYWKDLSKGEEYVFDITNDPLELQDMADKIKPDLLASWRREILSSGLVVRVQEPGFTP